MEEILFWMLVDAMDLVERQSRVMDALEKQRDEAIELAKTATDQTRRALALRRVPLT